MNYKDFNNMQKEDVKNMYCNGNSTVVIGNKYGVSHKTISRILDDYNIPRTGVGKRKYHIDEGYFDIIDTQNKAYFLGFLYADGCNYIPKQTVSISLEEGDKHILESFNLELKYDKPLEYIDYSSKHDFGYNYKNQYRLLIFSKHICESLNNHGMHCKKSLILKFPNTIPDVYMKDFIRGYFDGDGSFCPYYTKQGKFQPLITITSTQSFCMSLQNYIQQSIHIPCGNIYDASCHNGVTRVLSFSGVYQTKIFLDWLYKDAQLFLHRKHKKYIDSFYINNSLPA